MLRLIVLDIDGVLTDGKKYYGLDGAIYAKKYADKDFTAIKRFKRLGIDVCFLSGDKRINEKMAAGRKIDFYYSRNKSADIKEIADHYGATLNETAYVGDDYYDLEILKLVKYRFCPNDAVTGVKNICQVLPRTGGEGVVAELFEHLYPEEQDVTWLR